MGNFLSSLPFFAQADDPKLCKFQVSCQFLSRCTYFAEFLKNCAGNIFPWTMGKYIDLLVWGIFAKGMQQKMINLFFTSMKSQFPVVLIFVIKSATSLSLGQYSKALVSYFSVKTSLSVNKQFIVTNIGKMNIFLTLCCTHSTLSNMLTHTCKVPGSYQYFHNH